MANYLTFVLLFLVLRLELQTVSGYSAEIYDYKAPSQYRSYMKTPDAVKKYRNLMMPSRLKELTPKQRELISDNCRPVGMPCNFREECCSYLCLKRSRICVV
ncbi:uncharacterized protein LOC115621726 [Scaptodrosophila lebanonensis]|uniref:Uncharacterized protein LOC115621726 n=1 Tax=Drosophila lebanonensis TaxID=7225 RepID=A0A6J2T5I9_DROLE|nr:uncharacterized protein LOC115621726 [Scaptodrosophila lebanonensis]